MAPGCALRGTERTQRPEVEQRAEALLADARAREGNLDLQCAPPDAQVSVDGVTQGTCGDYAGRPLRLGTGLHRVEVKKQGLMPFESYVDPSGTRARISVSLAPAPKAPGEQR